MESDRAVEIFKALADPTRLALFTTLMESEACVCELLEKFSVSQPTLSHHMRILSDAKLVVGRREGKWIHYKVRESELESFKAFTAAWNCNATDNCEGCACTVS